MTTSNDPDEIRRDIERTRAQLSNDVNALADEAKPGNVAKRQVDKAKGSARDLKDRIMGSAEDTPAYQSMTGGTGAVQQFGADARQSVQDAPQQLKQKASGNPLAAGLIAFGLGALIGGLIPASRQEQRAVSDLAERAKPAVEQAKQVASDTASDVAGKLKEPAQEAVQNVRDSATDSVESVRETGQAHAQDVGDHTRAAKENVQQS
jgi:vacuolar-type H+-ATPase subunit H